MNATTKKSNLKVALVALIAAAIVIAFGIWLDNESRKAVAPTVEQSQ